MSLYALALKRTISVVGFFFLSLLAFKNVMRSYGELKFMTIQNLTLVSTKTNAQTRIFSVIQCEYRKKYYGHDQCICWQYQITIYAPTYPTLRYILDSVNVFLSLFPLLHSSVRFVCSFHWFFVKFIVFISYSTSFSSTNKCICDTIYGIWIRIFVRILYCRIVCVFSFCLFISHFRFCYYQYEIK